MSVRVAVVVLGMLSLAGSSRVLADWQDWWQTREQQSAEAFEQSDHERLLQRAPDAAWRGLGHYQAGDFDAAAGAFGERAAELQQQGNLDAANRALYNQGVSEVRAGRYDDAIDHFDTVLESDPSFVDALSNREIAEQLKQLQQQQEQPSQSQSGDEGEPGEGQQEGEPGQSGDQSEQGQSGDQDGSDEQGQSADSTAENQDGAGQDVSAGSASAEENAAESGESAEQDTAATGAQDDDGASGETEAERQAASDAAQRALDAEARQAGDASAEPSDSTDATSGIDEERPLSESEQATEQLLRRIPDDPAGLLRRRLQQSHRIEYPEARDGREAW